MAFPTAWDRIPGGSSFPVRSLARTGEAYIAIGDTAPDVDANDESPPIWLNAESNTIGLRASDSAIADGGAFTCDVRRVINDGNADTTNSQLVAQLSNATTAAYNCPPGEYVIVCTVAADGDGYIWIQGRNS